jgi:hypothetical protein
MMTDSNTTSTTPMMPESQKGSPSSMNMLKANSPPNMTKLPWAMFTMREDR